jgi:signal transduction histidine kinase
MNLKTRLALLYSLSVFIILIASALSIYFLNENFRKQEFIKRLVIEASEVNQLYASDKSGAEIKKALEANLKSALRDEAIYVYDSALQLQFASPGAPALVTTQRLFELVKDKKHYDFKINQNEAVILLGHQQSNTNYIIITANDFYGHRKGENLKLLLIFSVVGGILLSGFLAFFYVRHAMRPLEKLKGQIEKINEANLTERIQVDRKNDEVWQIAQKFNEMIERLQQAFEQRKNFVQHASHELRTPLANMLAHTESALNQNLSAEEYKITLLSLREDQQNLIGLTNSLLALSKYEALTVITDPVPVRIDEILYQTVELLTAVWPKAVIAVEFETIPDDENYLAFNGNEALIRAAVQNLVKNAILYSEDYKAKISIDATQTGIRIQFDNTGKQLLAEEISRLFIPFFRGENSTFKKGYGLGLSIVQRIVKLHKGTITYHRIGDDINRFTLFIPGA